MNRTIKEATVRRYYYDSHDRHLGDPVAQARTRRRLWPLRSLEEVAVFIGMRFRLNVLVAEKCFVASDFDLESAPSQRVKI